MAGINEDRDRQVVPLWRNFQATSQRGELAQAVAPNRAEPFSDVMVTEALADWEARPGLSVASDLVSISLTLGRFNLAAAAAKFVLDDPAAPASARGVAASYLAGGRPTPAGDAPGRPSNEPADDLPLIDRLRGGVRDARRRLIAYPRNPILWSNLARLHLSLGAADKAARAMRVGLALAPANRFVIRSAARFYLHQGQPDESHWLLANAGGVRSDPWLLAAEIATAAAIGRKSKNLKLGQRFLEAQRLPPFHLSELASAIGTIEALLGNARAARKLVGLSLIEPSENSIAQAAWLARKTGSTYLPPAPPTTSSEANAWNSARSGLWVAALAEAKKWQSEQPFSSRPSVFGTHVASVALGDHAEAVAFGRQGVLGNPDDFVLLNNLAFALASQDLTAEADHVLSRVNPRQMTPIQQATFQATTGLVAYRSGRAELGRFHYQAAIRLAAALRDKREHLARVYFAFEELRAGAADAGAARSAALDHAAALVQSDPSTAPLIERLRAFAPGS